MQEAAYKLKQQEKYLHTHTQRGNSTQKNKKILGNKQGTESLSHAAKVGSEGKAYDVKGYT